MYKNILFYHLLKSANLPNLFSYPFDTTVHTHLHTYIHTYIHATYAPTHRYRNARIHMYIHTYTLRLYAYIYSYRHTRTYRRIARKYVLPETEQIIVPLPIWSNNSDSQ